VRNVRRKTPHKRVPKTTGKSSKDVNCDEARPENYRGCAVAEELQKIPNSTIKETRRIRCEKMRKDWNSKRSTYMSKQIDPMCRH
jgi:hypothetical protein